MPPRAVRPTSPSPTATAAWIDGGPRAPLVVPLDGAAVVHSDSVELGRLTPQPAPVAAERGAGARPARGGRARRRARADHRPGRVGQDPVLTERYRHLLADRGYEREAVVALAYNKKAQEEMASRLPGLGARIQTLNAWGYGILSRALGRRPDLLDEREVRSIVEKLVPSKQRRVNTDPIAPYLDGLSLIRLGLRDPQEVEDSLDDVTGLAAAYEPYRDALRRRGRHRLRRAGLRRAGGAARTTASCGAPCRPTTATSSSTSCRTSRRPTCSSCAWPPAPPPTCSAWATTTSRSTATSAATRGSSSTTRRTSPAPASTPSR